MPDPYLASNEFPGDGVTTLFTISFKGNRPDAGSGVVPYISTSDVKAQVVTPATASTPEEAVDVPIVYVGPNQFSVTPATPVGKITRIYRATQDEYALVDYKSLQTVAEQDLDLSNRQLVFITQESHDLAVRASVLADQTNLVAYEAAQAAEAAAEVAAEAAEVAADAAESAANTAASVTAQLGRALRAPSYDAPIPDMPDAAARANTVLAFNNLGNPIASVPVSGSAADLAIDLANNSNPAKGSGLVGYQQGGADATGRTVHDKLREQAVSVYEFMVPADGANIRPALVKAVAAIKGGLTKSRILEIPFTVGEWTVDSTVLFDLSDFVLLANGNVRLTATTRQKTFLFASSTATAPVTPLSNVTVLSNGSYVNGNADTMTFSYEHGDGSDNDSAIRFNYVDNLYVDNWVGDNGPIDSFSTRQCRGKIHRCKFTRSKEDNGFSATTDWDPVNWAYGALETYGVMIVEDCEAYDCEDFGMTAFNCSAVFFIRGRVRDCRGGYSYEDSFASPDIKQYDGGFFGCWAFDCDEQGFYITADCQGLDIFCKSWNIRGFAGDNSDGLFENGVVVSNVKKIFIGGEHKKCGVNGIAVFNNLGYLMEVTVEGDIRDNDSSGIRGRGLGLLLIKPSTTIKGNGKVLVNSVYGSGIEVSNSGGAPYSQGLGVVKIGDCFIDDNGLNAVKVDYVGLVDVQSNICRNNAISGTAVAIEVTNATTAKILDNQCPSTSANQTFSVNIAPSVTNGYEGGNSGSGSTGIVANNATSIRQSDRGEMYNTVAFDPISIAAGSQVATTIAVVGATVGDFVIANHSSNTAMDLDVVGVVSTDGNVTVYFKNRTVGAIDLSSGTLRVLVTKRNGG